MHLLEEITMRKNDENLEALLRNKTACEKKALRTYDTDPTHQLKLHRHAVMLHEAAASGTQWSSVKMHFHDRELNFHD